MIAVHERAVRLLNGHRLTPESTLVLTERAARRIVDTLLPVFRDAIAQAYDEGREDRDRLRRERDADRSALLDVLGATEQHLRAPGHGHSQALRDAVARARRHLDRTDARQ